MYSQSKAVANEFTTAKIDAFIRRRNANLLNDTVHSVRAVCHRPRAGSAASTAQPSECDGNIETIRRHVITTSSVAEMATLMTR